MTLEKILQKHNLTEDELNIILRQHKKPKIENNNSHEHYYSLKKDKFIITGDWHVGHKNFRYDTFEGLQKAIKRFKVERVYHTGDLVEGMSNREGHIYELSTPGVSNQMNQTAEYIQALPCDMYFINGNHDLWAMKKSNQGFNVGKELDRNISNAHYLGDLKAEIKLSPTVKMWLTHEGNSAYALSYSGQKRINSIHGGNKPNVWFNGHLHKALYMEYRNIHFFESGTLQQQTEFMAMKGSPAHIGFWLCEIYHNKKGVEQVRSTWFPYY